MNFSYRYITGIILTKCAYLSYSLKGGVGRGLLVCVTTLPRFRGLVILNETAGCDTESVSCTTSHRPRGGSYRMLSAGLGRQRSTRSPKYIIMLSPLFYTERRNYSFIFFCCTPFSPLFFGVNYELTRGFV